MDTSILGSVWVLQPCQEAVRHPMLNKYHRRLSLSLILPQLCEHILAQTGHPFVTVLLSIFDYCFSRIFLWLYVFIVMPAWSTSPSISSCFIL